jgi:hypothetical protein
MKIKLVIMARVEEISSLKWKSYLHHLHQKKIELKLAAKTVEVFHQKWRYYIH